MSVISQLIYIFYPIIKYQKELSTKYNEPKYVFYIFLVIWIIFITLNLIGLKKMCQINVSLKFEEWVLISGIIEITLLILYLRYFRGAILITIIQSLQITITLIISRRFLKIYLSLNERNLDFQCYNFFFLVFIIFNILFIIVDIILNLSEIYFKHIIDKYELHIITPLIFDAFGLLSSFFLIIIGFKLKAKMITHYTHEKKSSGEVNQNNESFNNITLSKNITFYTEQRDQSRFFNPDYYNQTLNFYNINNPKLNTQKKKKKENSQTFEIVKATIKDISSQSEISFEIRLLQLNIIIWVTLFTDLCEFICCFFKLFSKDNYYRNNNGEEFPINLLAYIIFLIYFISMIFQNFMNYFAIYFLVRNTFYLTDNLNENENKNNKDNKSFNLNINNMNETNKNIANFLILE